MTLAIAQDNRPIYYIGMNYNAVSFARRHDISPYRVKVVSDQFDVITGPQDALVVLGPHWSGNPGEILNIFERIHRNRWEMVSEDYYDNQRHQQQYTIDHDGPWVYICWLRGSDSPNPLPTDKLFLYTDNDLYALLPDDFDPNCVKLVAFPTDDLVKTVDALTEDISSKHGDYRRLLFAGHRKPLHTRLFELPMWAIGQLIYKYGGIYLPEPNDHKLLRMALRYLDQTMWHGGIIRSVLIDGEIDGSSFMFASRLAALDNEADDGDGAAFNIITRVKELPELTARETLAVAQRLRVPVRHRT